MLCCTWCVYRLTEDRRYLCFFPVLLPMIFYPSFSYIIIQSFHLFASSTGFADFALLGTISPAIAAAAAPSFSANLADSALSLDWGFDSSALSPSVLKIINFCTISSSSCWSRNLVTFFTFWSVTDVEGRPSRRSRASVLAVIMKRESFLPSTNSRIALSPWSYVFLDSVRTTRV